MFAHVESVSPKVIYILLICSLCFFSLLCLFRSCLLPNNLVNKAEEDTFRPESVSNAAGYYRVLQQTAPDTTRSETASSSTNYYMLDVANQTSVCAL